MHLLLIAQLLTVLAVANGTPIIVEKFLGKFLAFPIDGGATLADGKPLFGSSKTLRGLALSIAATTAVAPLIGLNWRIGALVAAMAMLGDLLSSFLKRRMGLAPSRQALGLDQIFDSLLPPLACWFFLPLTIVDVVVATVIFFGGELLLSWVLFKLGIRIAKSGERTLGCVGFGTLEGKYVCLSRGRSIGFAAAGTLAHNRA